MNTLAVALMVWISGVTDLPTPAEPPEIRFKEPKLIRQLIHPDRPADVPVVAIAFYDRAYQTIVLPHTWDPRNPYHLSMLVHELVHHMQTEAGVTYPCRGARERVALDAQQAWLVSQGRDLFNNDVIRINEFFYTLDWRCRRGRPN